MKCAAHPTIRIVVFPLFCLLLFLATASHAEVISSLTKGDFLFKLERINDGLEVTINDSSPAQIEHFRLEGPTRIVFDIPGSRVQLQKALIVKDREVQQVRMSTHPDKLRIVVDLFSNTVPQLRQRARGSYTIGSSTMPSLQAETGVVKEKKQKAQAVGKETVTLVRRQNEKKEVLPVKVLSTKRISSPPPALVVKNDKIETVQGGTPKDQEVSSSPQLQNIMFLTGGESPSLNFKLNKKIRFTLAKKSIKKYILKLHECAAADTHLYLPYFPPHTFPGINLVQAASDGDDVSVTIMTERGVKLTPLVKGTEIVIEQQQGLS